MSISLPGLRVGERIDAALLIDDIDQRGGDNPHTILTFGNATGKIPSAPFWHSEPGHVSTFARGDVVRVAGEITQYRERRQVRVSSIHRVPPKAVNWRELLPHVPEVSTLWERLDRWRASITGPRLARTLALFYDEPAFRSRYQECPASLAGHHAQLGGLLQHTCEVAAIGRALAGQCGADWELVVAGALLHDIGKLESYRWDGSFDLTDRGALHGHVVLGSLALAARVQAEPRPPCTERELMVLQHLILSHHGKLEFGAPVLPLSLEAEVLHYADDASAKTAMMAHVLSDPANFPGEGLVSSRPLWQLDRRRVYRGMCDWGRKPAACAMAGEQDETAAGLGGPAAVPRFD